MHRQRGGGDMNVEQDLGEQWGSMASRLKLNFRSTSCSGQSFPGLKNQLFKGNLLWELQELILTHLPALKLLEVKAVCRSWRDLLQSSSFKEKWHLMRGGRGIEFLHLWVMRSEEDDLIAYVPALDKYFLFLPIICSSLVMAKPGFSFKINEVSFLCACGPMIVLANKDWRSHPCFFMYDSYSCGRMTVNELQLQGGPDELLFIPPSSLPVLELNKTLRCFCIAVELQTLGENWSHDSYRLCVYKFTTGTWSYYSKSSARQADISDANAVVSGSFFHYDQYDSTLYVWSTDQWIKVRVSFSDGAGSLPGMINGGIPNVLKVEKCREHVLMTTATVREERGLIAQCFTIWKLMKEDAEDSETWKWIEISRTPPELCLKSFNRRSFLHPSSMCDGERICVMVPSQEFFPALVYDAEPDRWYHLQGVLKDMQALFAMQLNVKIDRL